MYRLIAIGASLGLLLILGACSTSTATAWTYAPLSQGSMALAIASGETQDVPASGPVLASARAGRGGRPGR